MERFKRLGRYQKGVLLFMAAMSLVFAAVYSVTISKTGFAYKGELLVMSREDGVLICAVNGLLMLFADELFRWELSFRIRGADRAELSDWEIAGRYIGWTVLALMALAIFLAGLQ